MPGNIVLAWPIKLFGWSENWPVRKGHYRAKDVRVLLGLLRHQDLVTPAHTHQPFIERPVAKPAECQAVGREIIAAQCPGLDVGGLHDGVAFRE